MSIRYLPTSVAVDYQAEICHIYFISITPKRLLTAHENAARSLDAIKHFQSNPRQRNKKHSKLVILILILLTIIKNDITIPHIGNNSIIYRLICYKQRVNRV